MLARRSKTHKCESFGEFQFIYNIISMFSSLITLILFLFFESVTSLIGRTSVTVIVFWRSVRNTEVIYQVAMLILFVCLSSSLLRLNGIVVSSFDTLIVHRHGMGFVVSSHCSNVSQVHYRLDYTFH